MNKARESFQIFRNIRLYFGTNTLQNDEPEKFSTVAILELKKWGPLQGHEKSRGNQKKKVITQVYFYVQYSVLPLQLPQHCACETKHHFPYTVVPIPRGRKQLHESEYNSHELEMFPTTNSILTQRQVGC